MRRRLAVPLLAMLLIAGVIAGCGSSSNKSSASSGATSSSSGASSTSGGSSGASSVSAAAYVKSVCTALGPVVTSLRSKQAALAGATTPQDAKSALQDFISTLSSGLGTAIPQVQAAGTPTSATAARSSPRS